MENKENTKIYSFYDEVFIIDYINTEHLFCKIPRLRSIIEHFYKTEVLIMEEYGVDIIDAIDTDDLLCYCETGPKSLPNLISFFLLIKKFQACNFIESVDVSDDFEIHIQLHENVINEKEKCIIEIAKQIYWQYKFEQKTDAGQRAPMIEKISYVQEEVKKKVFFFKRKTKNKKIK